MEPQDFDELIKTTEQITDEPVKQDILDKIRDLQKETPLDTDKWIYRSVVWALGAAALLCLFFTFWIYLAWFSKSTSLENEINIPDIFLAIASASIGALAGLLAPSPAKRSN